MINAILYGLITGITLSFMLGPVFFSIIQNSIDNGFKSGIFISIGVISSDIILITLSHYNSNLIPKGGTTEIVVRIVGSGFLTLLGIFNMLKKSAVKFPHSLKKPPLLFLKGFTLNIMNPANFFAWLSVATYLKNVAEYTFNQQLEYYITALCTVFLVELLISFGALFLKKILTPHILHVINIVLAIGLFLFAILLILPLLGVHFPLNN